MAKRNKADDREPGPMMTEPLSDPREGLEERYESFQASEREQHADADKDALDLIDGPDEYGRADDRDEPAQAAVPDDEPIIDGNQGDPDPAPPAEAQAEPSAEPEYFFGNFKTREDAERAFQETQAWGHRNAAEKAAAQKQIDEMRKQLEALQANRTTTPQGRPDAGGDDLSPDQLERLQYEDYPAYLDYQRQREERLVRQAEDRAFQRLSQTITEAQKRQAVTALEDKMQGYFSEKYADLKPHKQLVESVVNSMAMDLNHKLQAANHLVGSGLSRDVALQQVGLDQKDIENWQRIQQNPMVAIDLASEQVRGLMGAGRAQGKAEAAEQRERLPETPVMAPGGGSTPPPPADEAESNMDYIAWRKSEARKQRRGVGL